MKPFNSVSIVKYPVEQVWTTIRDRLPELVPYMEDVEKITLLQREDRQDGIVSLDNLWQSNPRLPMLQSLHLDPDLFAWTDRAEWDSQNHTCRWRIEPRLLPDQVQCSGVARYEAALGGRGTRVTFEGQLGVSAQSLPGMPYVDASLLKGVELLASSLIPKNLRKMTEAVGSFLDQNP